MKVLVNNKIANILVAIILINVCVAFAQQRMQYSTQILQGYLQNPALVGVENYNDIRLLYNKQWTGFDGAPTAKAIGFATQVANDTNTTTSITKTLPLRGRKNVQTQNTNAAKSTDIKPTKAKYGWGGVLTSEGDGTISINEYSAMGSMQMPIKTNKLSLGLGIGLAQHQFNPANIKLINNYDLTFAKQQHSIIYPTMQFGTMYFTNEYFIGFSTKQVVKTHFTYDGLSPDKRSELIAHTTFTAGLRLKAGNGTTFTPSVIYRKVKNMPATADINLVADYLDFIKAGAMFRTNGDVAAILGIIISHKYSVQYSYDFSNQALRSLFANTHNLVISARIAKKNFSSTKPINFW